MKSTKKSLIASALSLVLCISMLLGTTYAWFTDSVTSGKNKIIAGNLDVELTHTNAKVTNQKVQDATDLFGVALWEPGVIAWENLTVTNVGNLALKYALNLNVFDKNATTEGHDLTEVIKVAVIDGGFKPTGTTAEAKRAAAQALSFGTLADFQKTGNLAGGDSTGNTFGVVLYWQPTDNDNLYNLKNGLTSTDGQPLFVEFGVNLVATQDTVEADSFDDQYDVSAPLAVMSKPMTKKLASTESLKIVVPEEAESSVKEASVPAAVANAVFDKVFTDSTTSDKSLTLVLNVEEKSKTDTTFNYEIDMDAVIKEVSGSTVIKNETKSVNDLGLELTDFVEVQMNIAPGLLNVNVKHNGNDMTKAASKEAIPAENQNAAGYFNYAKASGTTKLWIKSFSPFTVTGEKALYVDGIGAKEGYYRTFAEAYAAAEANDIIHFTAGRFVEAIAVREKPIIIEGEGIDKTFIVGPETYSTSTIPMLGWAGGWFERGVMNDKDVYSLVSINADATIRNLSVMGDTDKVGPTNSNPLVDTPSNAFAGIHVQDANAVIENVNISNIMPTYVNGNSHHGFGLYITSTNSNNYNLTYKGGKVEKTCRGGLYCWAGNYTLNFEDIKVYGNGNKDNPNGRITLAEDANDSTYAYCGFYSVNYGAATYKNVEFIDVCNVGGWGGALWCNSNNPPAGVTFTDCH